MTGPPEKFDENLTPQERRLLKLLSEGNSYQEIADHLGISVNTVRTYIRSVYEKLHVHFPIGSGQQGAAQSSDLLIARPRMGMR